VSRGTASPSSTVASGPMLGIRSSRGRPRSTTSANCRQTTTCACSSGRPAPTVVASRYSAGNAKGATRERRFDAGCPRLDRAGVPRSHGRTGVETRPERGIYLHLTAPTDFGFRVVEIWDEKKGFDRFVEQRLGPASEAIGLNRKMTIAVTPLHNFFAPRLTELPTLVASLPGAPDADPSSGRPTRARTPKADS
jgi:hypothetical protein